MSLPVVCWSGRSFQTPVQSLLEMMVPTQSPHPAQGCWTVLRQRARCLPLYPQTECLQRQKTQRPHCLWYVMYIAIHVCHGIEDDCKSKAEGTDETYCQKVLAAEERSWLDEELAQPARLGQCALKKPGALAWWRTP